MSVIHAKHVSEKKTNIQNNPSDLITVLIVDYTTVTINQILKSVQLIVLVFTVVQ